MKSQKILKVVAVTVLLAGVTVAQAGIFKKLLFVGGIGVAGAVIAAKAHAGAASAPANPVSAPLKAKPGPVSAAKPGGEPVAGAGPAVPGGDQASRALSALDGAKAKAASHTAALMARREWCVAQVKAGLIQPTATAQFACILGKS